MAVEVIHRLAVDLEVRPQLPLADDLGELGAVRFADDLDHVEDDRRRRAFGDRVQGEGPLQGPAFGQRGVEPRLLLGGVVAQVMRGRVEDDSTTLAHDPDPPEPVAGDRQVAAIRGRQGQGGLVQGEQGPLDLVGVARVVAGAGAPLDPDEQAVDRSGLVGIAAELERSDLGPGQRHVPAFDQQGRRVDVGRFELAEKLVAVDEPDVVEPGGHFEAADRLGQADQAEVVEGDDQTGRRGVRPDRGVGQADLDEGAAWPPTVGEFVAVDGQLDLGAEPDAQAVPAGLASEPLDGQRGPAGRLDRQAVLAQVEHHPDRLRPGRPPEEEVDEPLLALARLLGRVEGDLQPARGDRLGQAARHRRSSCGQGQAFRAGQAGLGHDLGLADGRPAVGVERLEPILEDQGLAGPLGQGHGPRPDDDQGEAARTVFEPDGVLGHRPQPTRNLLVEPEQDPHRRISRDRVGQRAFDRHRPRFFEGDARLAAHRLKPEAVPGVADDPAVARLAVGPGDRLQAGAGRHRLRRRGALPPGRRRRPQDQGERTNGAGESSIVGLHGPRSYDEIGPIGKFPAQATEPGP